MEWSVLILKAMHVSTISLWAAGLIILPLLYRGYRKQFSDAEYARFRKVTHYSYVGFLTPTAVIAVGSGIALIMMRDIYEPWLFAKLALVSALAILHAYMGHMIVLTAETRGSANLPPPILVLVPVLLVLTGILGLVLAKPVIVIDWPQWMTEPQSFDMPRWVPI
ncbi:CopD family protein [Blastomonas aquatica]|uniref:Membrane protein n=1 Tax=Blastomonas aquatica TaxID=1510276 RepID=A0ABQ1IZM6_9SPHN|nr:CopD family protein [Blastomonas aquatica]GGB55227.1 membrane protein [Blastomonas aquatica]